MAKQYPEVGQIWSREAYRGFNKVKELFKIQAYFVDGVCSQMVRVENLSNGGMADYNYEHFMNADLEYKPLETVNADFNDWMRE